MAKKKTTKKKGRIRRPNLMGETPADKKPTEKKVAPAKQSAKKAPRTKAGPTAGTLIERTFKGQKIAVQATADGYLYKGKTYKSLTAVALAVTGYAAISGPRFFATSDKGGAK